MNYVRLFGTAALLLSITISGGCSAAGPPSSPTDMPVEAQARVVVTMDFGQELILDQVVYIGRGVSALEALRGVAEVETTYGGGFVSAINGVYSHYMRGQQAKKDWSFYINGIWSNVGALEYGLHHGDVEHWDFHDWSLYKFAPAIIGDFPEPFVHGYRGRPRPTIIVPAFGLREAAKDLKSRLTQLGVAEVSTRAATELGKEERESCNLILLGTVGEVLIAELNQLYSRLGFYVHFENGRMVVLDSKGEAAAEYRGGVIQATQNPWNPKGTRAAENVVWVVSGTDEGGVREAAITLADHYSQFEYAFAAVVAGREIIRVPSDKLWI